VRFRTLPLVAAVAYASHRVITDALAHKAIDLMDVSASRLRMEVDSNSPTERDRWNRQISAAASRSAEGIEEEGRRRQQDRWTCSEGKTLW